MSDTQPLSFLPDDYLERKSQRRTNVICASLFLVVMLMLVAAFTITDRPLRLARQVNAEVARQYTEAAAAIDQFRQLQHKQQQVSTQADLAASLLEKVPRSFLLAQVTNALPPDTSLLELTLDSHVRLPAPAGPPRTQFEQKKALQEAKAGGAAAPETPRVLDVTVRVTGIAPTDVQVAQFMSKLSRSTLFNDVNLIISDQFEFNKEQVRKFQIEMTINGDADVDSADALLVGTTTEAR